VRIGIQGKVAVLKSFAIRTLLPLTGGGGRPPKRQNGVRVKIRKLRKVGDDHSEIVNTREEPVQHGVMEEQSSIFRREKNNTSPNANKAHAATNFYRLRSGHWSD